MPEALTNTNDHASTDDLSTVYARQIAEIITGTDTSAEDKAEALALILAAVGEDNDSYEIEVAWQLAEHSRADVRLYALEMLRPFSGRGSYADVILWKRLLQDKTAKVLVPTYEMLREHSQNATFEALSSGDRRTFMHSAADRVVMMSAAIPLYEYATRNRK